MVLEIFPIAPKYLILIFIMSETIFELLYSRETPIRHGRTHHAHSRWGLEDLCMPVSLSPPPPLPERFNYPYAPSPACNQCHVHLCLICLLVCACSRCLLWMIDEHRSIAPHKSKVYFDKGTFIKFKVFYIELIQILWTILLTSALLGCTQPKEEKKHNP
jgi:hypothetical protein